MTDEEPRDDFSDLPDWVSAHLHEAVAETLRRRAAKNAMRAELAERRAYGLQQRHAQKLRRIRGGDDTSKETEK